MATRMNNNAFKALTCLVTVGLTQALLADGYRNPPLTAEAIGKSGNAIVFTDDASAIAHNPANLAFQKDGSIVVSVTLAHLEHTYTAGDTGKKAVADDPWQPLPNIFVSYPLGDSGAVFGLGVTTPYGQGAEFGRTDLRDLPFRPNPIYEARLALVDINPTVAMQLNEKVAVGVGVSFIYSQLDFTQYFPWSAIAPVVPDGDADVDADGYAVGGNVGVTWTPTEKQRVALTYRSSYEVDYDGDFELNVFAPIVPGTTPKSDFSTKIDFPNIIGVGYGVELSDTVRVEANFEWLEWSSNENIKIDLANNQPLLGGQETIPNNWEDTIRVGVGGDWQYSDSWVFRTGYTFLETPIPDGTLSPILPDADRHAISVGFGFQSGIHAIDVAYTYSIYDDRTPAVGVNPVYPGSYDIDSDLLGLTYSRPF